MQKTTYRIVEEERTVPLGPVMMLCEVLEQLTPAQRVLAIRAALKLLA